MNPAGGAGALTAMHDAVALANWICTLQTKALPEIEAIFKEYRKERYPIAKDMFATSKMMRYTGGKVREIRKKIVTSMRQLGKSNRSR